MNDYKISEKELLQKFNFISEGWKTQFATEQSEIPLEWSIADQLLFLNGIWICPIKHIMLRKLEDLYLDPVCIGLCLSEERFGKGEFTLTVGMSGVELARRVLELTHNQVELPKPRYTADRSPEYWAGWALAYYQWETAMRFEDILEYITIEDVIRMYSPYHEMDIRHFCDRMNELYRKANPETKLKRLRQRAGLSQSELTELSGVPMRTIQQYEQRQKSINKAQAEYLMMLARALNCNAEDLIEFVE